MSPSRIRYVTACQQVLALGVVLAALVPAAAVVSLDVIREVPAAGQEVPGSGPGTGPDAPPDASTALQAAAERRSRALRQLDQPMTGGAASAAVPTTAVDPVVTEVPLGTGRPARRTRAGRETPSASQEPATARSSTSSPGPTAEVVSPVEPVTGYGAVGVTWAPGTGVADEQIDVEVRTRTDGAWSDWEAVEHHADHGPDPGSAEAAHARPGTDEALVGHVDDVQVRVATTGTPLPSDLSLAVIEPGAPAATVDEGPALTGPAPAVPVQSTPGTGTDRIALRAATSSRATGQPTIYSRAQWGADERLREQGPPQYGTVKGGFVHHTVNANDYTADEVPAIIRSIYAYHVKSRGWRDIGYNFLVDRFGRIWEGRFGGVDRPVQGAHTSGYNDEAFAMSAIGNYETAQPSPEMLHAYGQLFGWKLAISGVSASATNVRISGTTFPSSIQGHRDAGQTACPGQYLYAQLPAIRTYAAQAQAGLSFGPPWTGRDLSSDLVGSAFPDIVVRRIADGRGVLLSTGGLTRLTGPTTVSKGWRSARRIELSPDVTGDGRSDLVLVGATGATKVRPGDGAGRFGKPLALHGVPSGLSLLTPVGDLTGDGRADLVGRDDGNRLHVLTGRGRRTVADSLAKGSWKGYNLLAGPGDLTGDGRADLLARDRKGKLFLLPGTSRGVGKRHLVSKGWTRFDTITGGGDYTADGRADLVVRRAKTGEVSVVPGSGAPGAFGAPLGPVATLKGDDWVSGGQLTGGPTAELVARRGNRLVRLDNPGTTELTAPVETDLDLRAVTAVLDAGDLDRDGVGDVLTREADGSLVLHPGLGAGHYAPGVVVGTGFAAVTGLAAVGDRTGDGSPDLVGTQNGVTQVWDAHGRSPLGTTPTPTSYLLAPSGTDLSPYAWVVPISDGSGDGAPDVVVRRGGELLLLPGPAAGSGGSLGTPRLLGTGMEAYDLAG